MTIKYHLCALALAGVAFALSITAFAGEQEAIDGCIDKLREVGGPDARNGGQVLSSEFSQAATLVMLRDAGGTVWRCLAYSNGTVGEINVVEGADDGDGAMSGAYSEEESEPTTDTQRVHFDKGTSGTEITSELAPGSSTRWVLKAKNEQFLYVRVAAKGPDVYYQIFNPDNTFLLDQMRSAQEYRGQLWQSGDHVVEVINRGDSNASYNLIIGID